MKSWSKALVAAAIGVTALTTSAFAQSYPNRPVRIIVPFAAGGAMDVIVRVIAKKVSDDGGPQFVIENKTGAGGSIGVMAVKEAAPDGYTLAEVSSSTHVLNPHTTANIPYDPVKDFEPVVMLVRVPTLLAVPAGLPAKSFAELLEYGRKKPGGLTYGSAGVGSAPHITGALFARSVGQSMTHVPYRGLAGAMTDLVGGRLDFAFSSIPSLGGTVADGKIRVLAAAGPKRLGNHPNVPSMAELGHPSVDVDLWFGIIAPLKTDAAIVRTLNQMFVKATNSPDLAPRLSELGVEIATGTPEDFKKALVSDNARLGPFLKELMAQSK
ncbi:MAG: tripartite tricarboxylate transporter substrate binding protein [Alphaproteobacteria bacterium]|nr:tripartite tricarboxylate transporter substrate binding protein [Alphaproteobacteria bacterium]